MIKKVSLVVLAAFYILGGLNHFRAPDFYLPMMPPYLPAHLGLIYLSGVIEIALGVGVCIARVRRWSALAIIAMLVSFLPVHIHMILHSELYPQIPVWGLWLRLPIQALFIGWAYWHARE